MVKTVAPDTIQDIGYHEVCTDLQDNLNRDLYTDVYFVRSMLDDSLLGIRKILLVTNQHLSPNPAPHTKTDDSGRFSIPYSRIPLNETFIRYNETGDSIGVRRIGPTANLYPP